MAIEGESKSLTVTPGWRTSRVEIETAAGRDPVVTVHRGSYQKLPDGSMIDEKPFAVAVSRALSRIAADVVTVDGQKFTAAQVAGAFAAFADQWHGEDIENEANANPLPNLKG